MSKFEKFSAHKFENFNIPTNNPSQLKYDVNPIGGLPSFDLNEALANAMPIWEIQGMSEAEYYEKNPRTPIHEILKISEQEWRDTYFPKEIPKELPMDTIKEDIETITEDIKNIEIPAIEQEHIEPVKNVVKNIEKKIERKKSAKKSVKWT